MAKSFNLKRIQWVDVNDVRFTFAFWASRVKLLSCETADWHRRTHSEGPCTIFGRPICKSLQESSRTSHWLPVCWPDKRFATQIVTFKRAPAHRTIANQFADFAFISSIFSSDSDVFTLDSPRTRTSSTEELERILNRDVWLELNVWNRKFEILKLKIRNLYVWWNWTPVTGVYHQWCLHRESTDSRRGRSMIESHREPLMWTEVVAKCWKFFWMKTLRQTSCKLQVVTYECLQRLVTTCNHPVGSLPVDGAWEWKEAARSFGPRRVSDLLSGWIRSQKFDKASY